MNFDFTSFIRITNASNIDRTLTAIATTAIFLINLSNHLLDFLLMLRYIVLTDFTTGIVCLILFIFSNQILQISFILAVVGIRLFTLSYFRIVTLKCCSTLVSNGCGNWIVGHLIWVLAASVFAWGVLSVLNWEHVVNVAVWVWWVDHVEVVLMALAHCVFGGVHNRLLLVCTVSS